jgi:hypothetical protein
LQFKNVLARNEWFKVKIIRKWRREEVAINREGRGGGRREGSAR